MTASESVSAPADLPKDREKLEARLKELASQGVRIPDSYAFRRVMSVAVNGAKADEPGGVLAGRLDKPEE
ncbi:hypothetical protein ACYPKM_04665 [Pseudomonas aeruginosa]